MGLGESWSFSLPPSATTRWIHSCYSSFSQHSMEKGASSYSLWAGYKSSLYPEVAQATSAIACRFQIKKPTKIPGGIKKTKLPSSAQAQLRRPRLSRPSQEHTALTKAPNSYGSAFSLSAEHAHLPQHRCDETCGRKEADSSQSSLPMCLGFKCSTSNGHGLVRA